VNVKIGEAIEYKDYKNNGYVNGLGSSIIPSQFTNKAAIGMRPSNSTFGQPPSQANNIKKTQPSAPLQPQQQNKNFPNNNSYNNNSYNNNLQNKGPNNGNSGAVNRPPVSNNIPKSSNAIQKVNPIQSKTNAPME